MAAVYEEAFCSLSFVIKSLLSFARIPRPEQGCPDVNPSFEFGRKKKKAMAIIAIADKSNIECCDFIKRKKRGEGGKQILCVDLCL